MRSAKKTTGIVNPVAFLLAYRQRAIPDPVKPATVPGQLHHQP